MRTIFTKYLILLLCFFISACTITPRNNDNNSVRIIFHNELAGLSKINLFDCEYLGTIISSEGHWYDFLYISNTELATGAINKMHNLASEKGANIIYVDSNVDFKTSVTFIGQAYKCNNIK